MKNVIIFIYIQSNTVIKPFAVHVEVVYSILIHPQRCMAQEKPHCPVLFHAPKRSTKPYFQAPRALRQSARGVSSKQAAQCGRNAAADWLRPAFSGTHPRSSNVFGHEFHRESRSSKREYG